MTTEIQKLEAEIAAQAARIEQLTAENLALKQILTLVCDHDYEPEYHSQGMGCGLEDRGITDRYDAMEYGWNEAMERVYSEVIPAIDEIETPATDTALREIQAQGIKYARNRLIASFTHGFLDKPESEVRDICRMLDDAASELKNEATDDWVSETFGDEFLAAPLGV